MNYLLFNNEIYISDGQVIKKFEKEGDLKVSLGPIDKARICCVEVDVMIASAPQDYLEKRDSLLAQKFEAVYSNDYITLNERIADNIFQVIGIKAVKVKEIYSLVPSSKVETFVPYAIAIRSLLENKGKDMKGTIVFVDDTGVEKLITVFDGLKFSRTRTIHTLKVEDILPDIKRSNIDFFKKLGEFAGKITTGDFTIITNNEQMAEDIKFSEPGLAVEFIDCPYPSLEGLKSTDSQVKYRIHEEIILERKKKEMRLRLIYVIVSLSICLAGASFFGINQITYSFLSHDFNGEVPKNDKLKEALAHLDQYIYRDFLRKSKYLNYAGIFFEVSGLLPSTYEISSFKFACHEDHWFFDTYIFAQDDQFYDEIPRSKILQSAKIKDFFIKSRPGKYLRITL